MSQPRRLQSRASPRLRSKTVSISEPSLTATVTDGTSGEDDETAALLTIPRALSTLTRASTGGGRQKRVRFKVIIRRIDKIDSFSQTCFMDYWYGATDSEIIEKGSSTDAFQKYFAELSDECQAAFLSDAPTDDIMDRYKKAFRDEFPRIPPVWHINLLNMADIQLSYAQRGLPTIRYFDDGSGAHYERNNVQCKAFQPFDLELFPFDFQSVELYISLDVKGDLATFATGDKGVEVDFDPAYNNVLSGTDEWNNIDPSYLVTTKSPAVTPRCSESESPSQTKAAQGVANRKPSSGHGRIVVWSFENNDKNRKDFANAEYPRLTIRIPLVRKADYFIHGVLLPIKLVELCSVFAASSGIIKETNAENQLSFLELLATLLVALFSFRWSTADKIPVSSKTTVVDRLFTQSFFYFSACIVIVCLSTDDRKWWFDALNPIMYNLFGATLLAQTISFFIQAHHVKYAFRTWWPLFMWKIHEIAIVIALVVWYWFKSDDSLTDCLKNEGICTGTLFLSLQNVGYIYSSLYCDAFLYSRMRRDSIERWSEFVRNSLTPKRSTCASNPISDSTFNTLLCIVVMLWLGWHIHGWLLSSINI